MAEKKRFLRLESLVAYLQTERDGDEIFIRYKDEKIAPARDKFIKMSKEPALLDIEIPLESTDKWVELELWDYDRFSANDCLGKFKLLVDEAAEHFTAELVRDKASDARYVLHWSVINRNAAKQARPSGK